MIELRNESVRDKYISDKCNKIFGDNIVIGDISFIDEGVMNFIYKVDTSKGNLFFKQALTDVKNKGRVKQDLASIPHQRIKYEKNVIDKLKMVMPDKIKLPNIYKYDEENNILILSDVGGAGELLQNALLSGDFDTKIASNIGIFLGLSHKYTYGFRNIIREDIAEDKKNWEIFLNMRTRGIASSPRLGKKVGSDLCRFYNDVLSYHTYNVLINMDCCPKNIFQRKDKSIGVIDFELASGVGDPAYDVGFILGHYFLFSILKGNPKNAIDSIHAVINSYVECIENLDVGDLVSRAIKYAGAVMPYRIVGSSPAEYIPKDRYEELISKGSSIILSNVNNLDEVVLLLKKENI